MKTRINKYLVGALLCAITHNGYSMEDKTGIDLLDSDEVKNFARAVQKNLKDAKVDSAIEKYKETENGSEKSIKDILTPLINSKKKEEVEEGLKKVLQFATGDWKKVGSKAKIWNALRQLIGGAKIGDETIDKDMAMKIESYDKLQNAIASKPDYEKYLYKTDKTKKMEYLKDKDHSIVTNESTMLHDDQSNIIIEYKDKKEDLKKAKITIAADPIPANRMETILESKKSDYKFLKEDENDAIRKYIATTLESKEPSTTNAKQILTDLHTTQIGKEDAAGEAIREYIRLVQNYDPRVKAKYKGRTETIPENADLNNILKTINNDLHITDDEYTMGYEPNKETLTKLKTIQDKYKINLNETNIAKHRYESKVTDEQVNEMVRKRMAPQLLSRIEEYDALNQTLKKQTEADEKTIKLKDKENEDLKTTKTDLENQIRNKEAEIQTVTDEINQLKVQKQQLEDEKNNLQTQNDDLKSKNNDLTSYAQSLCNILEITAVEGDLDTTYDNIEAEVTRIKEGTPLNDKNAQEAIKAKEKEIGNLKARIQALEKTAGAGGKKDPNQAKEIQKLEKENNEKASRIQELEKQLEETKKLAEGEGKSGITATELNALLKEIYENAKDNNPRRTAIKDIAKQIQIKYLNTIDIPK